MKKLLVISLMFLITLCSCTTIVVKEEGVKMVSGQEPGDKVIEKALELIRNNVIVKGSCWDWVNRIFVDAGYPDKKRERIFYTGKNGPYANHSWLKTGDWIMFVNLSYKRVEHSGIFHFWVDKNKRIAMVLSYGGEKRVNPGRSGKYDITYLFGIQRAKK